MAVQYVSYYVTLTSWHTDLIKVSSQTTKHFLICLLTNPHISIILSDSLQSFNSSYIYIYIYISYWILLLIPFSVKSIRMGSFIFSKTVSMTLITDRCTRNTRESVFFQCMEYLFSSTLSGLTRVFFFI